MKALTVYQPWASLIIVGAKPWEWRQWAAPRSLVGQRIAIHAGARPVSARDIAQILAEIRAGESSLIPEKALPLLKRTHVSSWARSAVLGTAVLGEPITALAWARQHDRSGLDSDRIDHHKWAWPLTEIEELTPIVPAKGAQGFWEWTP